MKPVRVKSIRIVLWFVAFLPIIALNGLLISTYINGYSTLENLTQLIVSGIMILGAYVLAYSAVSKNKFMNLIGVILMVVWVIYLFIENSHKFPPIRTAPIFVIYFGTILSITCIINHFE